MNKESEIVLFLPAAICLLNFNLSVGDIPTAWAPQVLAGTMPARSNFLTSTFMKLFWKALFFLMSENLTLHFFLLLFPFAPNFLTHVLKSTPSVSTLSGIGTPSSLLH